RRRSFTSMRDRAPSSEGGASVAPILPVVRSLCWATHEEAERLGVGGAGTRHWAYRWIEEHVRHLARVDVLADLGGGGLDAELCKRLAPYAGRVLVIDQTSQARR